MKVKELFTNWISKNLKMLLITLLIEVIFVVLTYLFTPYLLNSNNTIKFLTELYKGKYSGFYSLIVALINFFVIDLIFNCMHFFEWLKDWELTFNASLAEFFLKACMIVSALTINLWRSRYTVLKPKAKFSKSQSILNAANFINIGHLITCAVISFIIVLIIFGSAAIILFLLKKHNENHDKQIFIKKTTISILENKLNFFDDDWR